jgi:hypothetical protein
MAKYRISASFPKAVRRALAHEGRGVAKGVAKELLSIATLGLYKPKRHGLGNPKRRSR